LGRRRLPIFFFRLGWPIFSNSILFRTAEKSGRFFRNAKIGKDSLPIFYFSFLFLEQEALKKKIFHNVEKNRHQDPQHKNEQKQKSSPRSKKSARVCAPPLPPHPHPQPRAGKARLGCKPKHLQVMLAQTHTLAQAVAESTST